jgi:hypothetical protein
MLKKTADTTAATPLGLAQGKKLLRVLDGIFAGRSIMVMATSSSTIAFAWADAPFTTWSAPAVIATDADDKPFDATMDSAGTVHVVYTEQTTGNLVTKKLTFSGGSWSAGSKVTIYNGNPSYMPSVVCESNGKLWVSWSRMSGGQYFVHAKSSVDSGATWGTGSADGGEVLTTGLSWAISKLLIRSSNIYCFYQLGTTGINYKFRASASGTFASETTVVASGVLTDHWDAGVSADLTIGIVYDNGSLQFRDYDGFVWSTPVTIDAGGSIFLQLTWSGATPVVAYISIISGDQTVLKYSFRNAGQFSASVAMDKRTAQFNSVLLYRAGTGAWQTVTAQCADAATADVYHPDSGAIIKNAGDRIYFGMDNRFRYIKQLLSSAGTGGTVFYSYWDGTTWKTFTPTGGVYPFDAVSKDLLLWPDYASIPADWQATAVNGVSAYWLKVEALTTFTNGPVGSQLTTFGDMQALSVRR